MSSKAWTRRERVWAVLRMQTAPWTYAEIAAETEAPLGFVRSFVGRLVRVGYVRRVNRNERVTVTARFRLAGAFGPRPPTINERTVIDPNIKTACR